MQRIKIFTREWAGKDDLEERVNLWLSGNPQIIVQSISYAMVKSSDIGDEFLGSDELVLLYTEKEVS